MNLESLISASFIIFKGRLCSKRSTEAQTCYHKDGFQDLLHYY